MIKITIKNRASQVTKLIQPWMNQIHKKEEAEEEAYARMLWGNFFGYNHQDYYDDEYWGDEIYRFNTSNAFHHYDDDEDDEEEYAQFLEQHPDVVTSGIWDDDEQWENTATKYDTYEKSDAEIKKALRDTSYNYTSPVYRDIQKKQRQKEKDWRKEIQESLLDDERCIYYYDNPRNENSKREFTSLDDFFMFCEDNDIEIDDVCKSDIEFYTQCHCGLDEYALNNGRKELRASRSYGELMYDLYGSDMFYDMDTPEYTSASSNFDDLPF